MKSLRISVFLFVFWTPVETTCSIEVVVALKPTQSSLRLPHSLVSCNFSLQVRDGLRNTSPYARIETAKDI